MSGRELVILLLGLAIVAVVLRGLYVAINARRGQIRLAIDKNIPQNVDLDALEMAELPGGGARVVTRSLEEVNRQNSALDKAQNKARAIHLADDDDEEHIPVLMDAVELSEPAAKVEQTQAAEEPIAEAQPEEAAAAEQDDYYNEDDFEDDIDEDLAPDVGQAPELGDGWEDDSESDNADYESADADEEDTDAILFDYEEDDQEEDSPRNPIDTMSSVAPDYDEAQDDDQPDDESYDELAEDIENNFDEDTDTDSYEKSYEKSYEDDSFDEPEESDASIDDEEDYAPFDADSSVDEFSMTAGERIGGDRPTKSKPNDTASDRAAAKQSSLFDESDSGDVQTDEESGKNRSLFTLFGRKSKRSQRRDEPSEVEDIPSAAVPEQEEIVEQHSLVQDTQDEELDDPMQPAAAEAAPQNVEDRGGEFEQSEVLVLNVMAKDGRVFAGDDLLHILITSGLKFGDMNIFHKRLSKDNQGAVIFSVANMLNPGTFDLNNMDEFTTLGISFFLALPTPINNLDAFEQMLDVAQRIRDNLGGDLKDDHRNGMTAQTIEHYRQRIRDFELRRLKAKAARG